MSAQLRRWDVELHCRGYYGFGGGYAKAQGFDYASGATYCNVCPLGKECWERHRRRCQAMLPGLCELFDKMAKAVGGSEAVTRFHGEYRSADPYTVVMGGNLEDGLAIGYGGVAHARGAWSLSWPLEPLD